MGNTFISWSAGSFAKESGHVLEGSVYRVPPFRVRCSRPPAGRQRRPPGAAFYHPPQDRLQVVGPGSRRRPRPLGRSLPAPAHLPDAPTTPSNTRVLGQTAGALLSPEAWARDNKSRHGGPSPVQETLPEPARGRARGQVGKAFGASGKTVDRATKVLKECIPEVVKAVYEGRGPALTIRDGLSPRLERVSLSCTAPGSTG